MSSFIYGVWLQWKLDFRNKDIIVVYYIVPLVFFGFMGFIFSSINPLSYQTLIASMSIFGVTMGAYLGVPSPLVEMYGSNMKKSYKVGGIPLWTAAVNNFISGCLHLFVMCLIIYIIAPIAYDAMIPEQPLFYFFALFLYIMVSTLLGTLLGLFVKSVSKLTMACQLLFLPSIMLSGIMLPNEFLPDTLAAVGKVFPATWAFQMMQQSQFSFSEFWPLLIVFVISFIGCIIQMKRIAKD